MAILQTEVGYLTKILQALTNEKNAINKQTLVVTNIAQGLTVPAGAISALIQVESTIADFAIRYWEDGSIPTSTVGFFQGNTAVFELTTAENLRNFKVIQGTAGTTQLNITYYK